MRLILKTALLVLGLASNLYAGGMGAAQMSKSDITPFLAGEATYTWPDVYGYNINVANVGDFISNVQNEGWGGRIAAGVLKKMSDRFSASAEMGWGYYGRTNLKPGLLLPSGVTVIPTQDTFRIMMDQYGFDALAGVLYTQPKYDLFFKAGALFENFRVDASTKVNQMMVANPSLSSIYNGNIRVRVNLVQVQPEVKLGGAYHVTDKTLVTLAWMHAFGSSFEVSAPHMNFQPIQLGNMTFNLQNPTLNSVMFGLEHRFG